MEWDGMGWILVKLYGMEWNEIEKNGRERDGMKLKCHPMLTSILLFSKIICFPQLQAALPPPPTFGLVPALTSLHSNFGFSCRQACTYSMPFPAPSEV